MTNNQISSLRTAVLTIGARVEGGTTEEDYDTGTVTAVDGDLVTVAWSAGVRTTQPYSVLRLADA